MISFKKILPRSVLYLTVFLLIIIRILWEYLSPINPDDFKGFIYLRDIIVLAPASIILLYLLINKSTFRYKIDFDISVWIKENWKSITIIMAILVFCFCSFINIYVFKTCAHIVDEANYLFQAKVFASGRLAAAPPALSREFFHLLYFIQLPEKWISSFFPGQSVLLAAGILLKIPHLINPFFTAILLIVTVWAGIKIYSKESGVIAGFLLLCSPFVLFQGASYFSHIFPTILITIILVWLLKEEMNLGKIFISGIMTGIIVLFRPLSALVLIIFILFYFIFRNIKSDISHNKNNYKFLIMYFAGILPGMLLFFNYNHYITGQYLTTPHQLALPNETLGIGIHSIRNTLINLTGLSVDLLGLPIISLIPVILFFISSCKYSKWLFIFSSMYCLAYSFYPYHGLSYGPRFYFEIVPILLIGSVQVLFKRGSFPIKKINFLFSSLSSKRLIFTLIITVPIISLLGIIPGRVSVFSKRGEYYHIEDTIQEKVKLPAVVSLTGSEKSRLIPYLAGFQLNSPNWNDDIIFVRYIPEKIKEIRKAYPYRKHYILNIDKKIVFSDS